MLRDTYYRDVLWCVVAFLAVFLLTRITLGFFSIAVVLAGCVFALRHNYAGLAFCYLLFPIFTVGNYQVCGLNGIVAMSARLGCIVIGFVALFTSLSNRCRSESLPIKWIFVYVGVAAISSIDGWFPMISYLKLALFTSFIIGIVSVSAMMQDSYTGLRWLRAIMMAMAVIMVIGSIVLYFIPSMGYSMMLTKMESFGDYSGLEGLVSRNSSLLFNGMTCHSQMLSPVVSMLATWVLCDMLLVEQRIRVVHLIILASTPILLFMSRSRGGFLTFVVVMAFTLFVCLPKARLSNKVRVKMISMVVMALVGLVLVGIYAQIKDQSISRWLRKTEDVDGDNRSLSEAMTSSRMGLVEENLQDFYLNPFLGKGFQVMPWLKQAYGNGFITWYSAPIEKGVTPFVILGETGLLGAGVFIVFLGAFYKRCLRRRYLALMNMFTCTLIANLADSTLFSPSGLGGFLWVVPCIGGYGLDLMSIRRVRMQNNWIDTGRIARDGAGIIQYY